jgi:hypothetical protein
MHIAVLITGQFRRFDFCIESIKEHFIEPNLEAGNTMDIFIVTQDAICLKPRLGRGITNQYAVVYKSLSEINKSVTEAFGANLKSCIVRKMFDTYAKNQNEDLTFKSSIGLGWIEPFQDLKVAIEDAERHSEENDVCYDSWVRMRPDLIFTKDMIVPLCPKQTLLCLGIGEDIIYYSDIFFIMDDTVINKMKDFYMYYKNKSEKAAENVRSSDWKVEWNAEYNLTKYISEEVNAKVIGLGSPAEMGPTPIGWLISDYLNEGLFSPYQKHQHFAPKWKAKFIEYVDTTVQCVFDL